MLVGDRRMIAEDHLEEKELGEAHQILDSIESSKSDFDGKQLLIKGGAAWLMINSFPKFCKSTIRFIGRCSKLKRTRLYQFGNRSGGDEL